MDQAGALADIEEDVESQFEPFFMGENGLEISQEVMEQVLKAKKGDPSKFVSYWEMDENDIDEPTEEQIQNDPVIRTLWAAENGNLEVVKEMLCRDKSLIQATDADGYTPLHRASYNGHLHVIEFLLEEGADVKARTADGWQPLHSACNWNQTEAAEMLLHNGADINAQTNGGQTALHLAAYTAENPHTLELLLMNDSINGTLRNGAGETAGELCHRSNKYGYLFEIIDENINRLSRP